MKTLYFDCFAGISGDMTLGALIAAGVDADELRKSLQSLNVDGYTLEVTAKVKGHIAATDVNVVLDGHHHHHHRHLGDIVSLIDGSDVSDWVKDTAGQVFRRLAHAEATVHGSTVDGVHFHEVGAVDAIVDIVGTAICFDLLGRPEVYSSPMPTFYGFATGSHGTFPLPAPATVELLKGIPWRKVDAEGELVTPTGAALITTIASGFGPMPPMTIEKTGYGSGKQDFGFPNVLRVMLGEQTTGHMHGNGKVSVIETNIDDLNPQIYESVMDRLFAGGALDVYLSPIQMKKNRPGTLLSVIAPAEKVTELSEIVLRETSSLGVRISESSRVCLDRRWVNVDTQYGSIRIKIGEMDGQVMNASPEYEDCRKASEEHKVPVKRVHDAAVAAYLAE